jgi:hypothetical protein
MLQSESPPDLLQLPLRAANGPAATRLARIGALKTASAFIKALGAGPHLERNAARACDALWRVFSSDGANDVRAAALKPLRVLIKLQPGALAPGGGGGGDGDGGGGDGGGGGFDVRAMYDALYAEYKNTKAAQTLRGEILKVLGTLVAVYSEELSPATVDMLLAR